MIRRAVIRVSGRVQGVFFRASARYLASKLGLKGYAKNMPDGSVLIVAEGPEEAIEELYEWSKKGPELARVEKAEISWEEPTGEFGGFGIG